MGAKARKPTAATTGEEPAVHEGAELPERWSVQRKTELVLRLLRGEGLIVRRREGNHLYYALADRHVVNLILNALAHATELAAAPAQSPQRRS